MQGLQLQCINTLSKVLLLNIYRDIGNEIVQLLESEFNKLYEDNDVIKIETKIRNIRFLGELAKFNVCPS